MKNDREFLDAVYQCRDRRVREKRIRVRRLTAGVSLAVVLIATVAVGWPHIRMPGGDGTVNGKSVAPVSEPTELTDGDVPSGEPTNDPPTGDPDAAGYSTPKKHSQTGAPIKGTVATLTDAATGEQLARPIDSITVYRLWLTVCDPVDGDEKPVYRLKLTAPDGTETEYPVFSEQAAAVRELTRGYETIYGKDD